MSVERVVCSCAELQVFSCYRGWTKACQATRAISTVWRCELSSSFFPARQSAEGNSRHFERNVRGTCTIVYHRQKLGGPFKLCDFSTCDLPRPGRPKTVTTPEIIDQIHELILEDGRISAKSIAEQLTWAGWVHHSWRFGHAEALREVGPEMPERGSKTSTVPVVWGTFGIFFGAIQMISCCDWWPWTKLGYIALTRRQSNNQWTGGIVAHPAPKTAECKNALEMFSLQFSGIKTASSSLITFHRTKLSTRSISHLYWCNWRTLWRKKPREDHQGVLVLARQCPGSLDTCNPEETGLPGFPLFLSPNLFSGSGPVGLPPVPWT